LVQLLYELKLVPFKKNCKGWTDMNLLSEAMGGLGGALLPVVAGLLLEELTLGGLVRLLIIPRPTAGKQLEQNRERGDGQ
jgi:hypothetical protein